MSRTSTPCRANGSLGINSDWEEARNENDSMVHLGDRAEGVLVEKVSYMRI